MTHAIYQKKTLCRGNFLVKCKIVIIKPVLGKKAQKNKKYLHCWTLEFLPLFLGNRNTRNCW